MQAKARELALAAARPDDPPSSVHAFSASLHAVGQASPERQLAALLGALRRPRDEAQWTRMIAAVAESDPGVARVLIDAERNAETRRSLAGIPSQLTCQAEVQLHDAEGRGLGRVDLVFADETASSSCWWRSSWEAATASTSWSATAERSTLRRRNARRCSR